MIFEGHQVPETIPTLCGQEAEFDYPSGIGYRCTTCGAIIGSIGMPRECATLYEMQRVVDKLRGKHV